MMTHAGCETSDSNPYFIGLRNVILEGRIEIESDEMNVLASHMPFKCNDARFRDGKPCLNNESVYPESSHCASDGAKLMPLPKG